MKRTLFFVLMLSVSLIAGFASSANTFYKSNAVASYYAEKFHGRKTANGEAYNMYDLTAAHKTLPFNTKVRVTNLVNGKSVVVRINDRGPFIEGREIDLSKAAAYKLDMLTAGTANVSLEIVGDPEGAMVASTPKAQEKEIPVPAKEAAVEESAKPKASLVSARAGESEVVSETEITFVPEPVAVERRYNIQLAAFTSRENAAAFAKKVQKAGFSKLAYQTTESGITRVIIRDLSADEVRDQTAALERVGFTFLVKQR